DVYARFFERMSVTCFIKDVWFSFRKIDEDSGGRLDHSLNFMNHIALKLAPINSIADRSDLFGCITHGQEEYILVLGSEGHGSEDKPFDIFASGEGRPFL